jgi:hypothetical protein
MNREERERIDEFVRDFRVVLKEHPAYSKYKDAVRVDQGCAAMLLGERRDTAAFRTLTGGIPAVSRGEGYGNRKMYGLRDLARAIVAHEN